MESHKIHVPNHQPGNYHVGAENLSTVDGFTWLNSKNIRPTLQRQIFGEPSTGTPTTVTCLSMTRGLSWLMHELLDISWIMFQGVSENVITPGVKMDENGD